MPPSGHYEIQRHLTPPRRPPASSTPTATRISEAQARALRPLVTDTQDREHTAPQYPPPRPRPCGAYPTTVEKYERYEELTATAGAGGAFVLVGTFSGYPDAIDLLATGGDALVSLRDHAGREESTLRLIANVPRETHISRHRVFASNVSDAAPATVRATGKWAEPYAEGAQ